MERLHHADRPGRASLIAIELAVYSICCSGDPQDEFDQFYSILTRLLDTYYPERFVIITSADPPYLTPTVKHVLLQKNKLMRSGRIEEAAALMSKIGVGKDRSRFCSAELSRPAVLSNATGMWMKVRQLTGRSKNTVSNSASICAETLNDHYAAVSTDALLHSAER